MAEGVDIRGVIIYDAEGVLIGTPANPLLVKEQRASTSATSSVAHTGGSITYLAANAARLGATIYNDDGTATLKLKLGSAASSTDFTVLVAAGGYYEVPFCWTGIITGISSAASGSARVTELTA